MFNLLLVAQGIIKYLSKRATERTYRIHALFGCFRRGSKKARNFRLDTKRRMEIVYWIFHGKHSDLYFMCGKNYKIALL